MRKEPRRGNQKEKRNSEKGTAEEDRRKILNGQDYM